MASNVPFTKKHFVKMVFIGDTYVGKTSLIHMFGHKDFVEDFQTTVGCDFTNRNIQMEDE